ncbi:hypothetical protein L9F63_002962, partial [Diploptera punctata]
IKICDSDSIFSPEFQYDIGFSPSRKVSERQEFIISNTSIFYTFVTIQYSNIRTHLEIMMHNYGNKWRLRVEMIEANVKARRETDGK